MTAAAEAYRLNVVVHPGYNIPNVHGDQYWASYLIGLSALGLRQICQVRRSATRFRPGGAR